MTGHWSNVTVLWWRHSGTFARAKQSSFGPVKPRSEQRWFKMLYPGDLPKPSSRVLSALCQPECPAFWEACLWYQLVILASFHTGALHALQNGCLLLGGQMWQGRKAWDWKHTLLCQFLDYSLFLWPSCGHTIKIQAHYWGNNSIFCIKLDLKYSMAPNGNVCIQFVIVWIAIQNTQILTHTNQYIVNI